MLQLPLTVDKLHLKEWDNGVFSAELRNLSLLPRVIPSKNNVVDGNPESLMPLADPVVPITDGTYRGTQLALTELFNRIETRYVKLVAL